MSCARRYGHSPTYQTPLTRITVLVVGLQTSWVPAMTLLHHTSWHQKPSIGSVPAAPHRLFLGSWAGPPCYPPVPSLRSRAYGKGREREV
ncbi:hypothetical protein GE21DRAFT_1124961 [Neurospora crassa]|nr:hypothetical protein GE21DRAFT_1124961 [Neurospora crassa]